MIVCYIITKIGFLKGLDNLEKHNILGQNKNWVCTMYLSLSPKSRSTHILSRCTVLLATALWWDLAGCEPPLELCSIFCGVLTNLLLGEKSPDTFTSASGRLQPGPNRPEPARH